MATITVKASNVRNTTTDVDSAVDVSVLVTIPGEGECRGDVTLVPVQDSRPFYAAYGDGPDMWVSVRLLGWLRATTTHDVRDMLDEIEAAASKVAGRPS